MREEGKPCIDHYYYVWSGWCEENACVYEERNLLCACAEEQEGGSQMLFPSLFLMMMVMSM